MLLRDIKLEQLEQQVFDPSCSKNPRICVMFYRGKWYVWEGQYAEFYAQPPTCTCKYAVRGFTSFENLKAGWKPKHHGYEAAKITLITANEVRYAIRLELAELNNKLENLIDQ